MMSSTARSSIGLNYDDADVFCKTEVMKSKKFKFVWEVSDFSLRCDKKGESLKSEEFVVKGPGSKVTKWIVLLYPRGLNGPNLDGNIGAVGLRNASDQDV